MVRSLVCVLLFSVAPAALGAPEASSSLGAERRAEVARRVARVSEWTFLVGAGLSGVSAAFFYGRGDLDPDWGVAMITGWGIAGASAATLVPSSQLYMGQRRRAGAWAPAPAAAGGALLAGLGTASVGSVVLAATPPEVVCTDSGCFEAYTPLAESPQKQVGTGLIAGGVASTLVGGVWSWAHYRRTLRAERLNRGPVDPARARRLQLAPMVSLACRQAGVKGVF